MRTITTTTTTKEYDSDGRAVKETVVVDVCEVDGLVQSYQLV